VKIVQDIGSVLDKDIEYQSSIKTLTFEGKSSKLIMPVESYRYFITSFVLLGLVPLKYWKASLNAIVFVLLFVAMRAAIISFILLIYKGTVHHVLLVWLDPTIFIAMLVIGLYIVKQNNILNRLYISLNFRFSEIITTSLSSLVLLLILLPPLPRVLFNYIHSDIMPGIVSFILYFSKIFLGWMGKKAEVSGRFIMLENNWIDLEYPCIGLGVFTLVTILIFTIKGKILNKVIYLFFFALVYLMLNALRLSVLLLYINNTYHQIGLNKIELHNNATYFMYLVAFGGFLGYWGFVEQRTIDKSK
ncbi:MAG: hypothetical protein ACOYMA_05965, partial [Bacteroidia bacterium]